jgi:oligopeptidase B
MNTTDEKVLRKINYKNYNSKLYESKRLLVDEKIGLYISIVYKQSKFKKDGTNKGHLYAYGSYGLDVDVDFDKYIISLLDRGYVYAIAHVRGSSYLGKNWYESGKLMKKKNTFNDFIKCSKFLIKNNYVSVDGLSISGGSAGGLLIGNVVNKKPSLYKSAILDVPFVDCLTTMLDSSLPLTTGEYLEWGNPEKSKTVYKYMLSYSPIDNIKDKKYPNILITTGINDTRVAFWEPVKYCAKMRKVVSSFKDERDLMMKIDLNAGHGGASGRYQYMRDEAFKYAFLIKYT